MKDSRKNKKYKKFFIWVRSLQYMNKNKNMKENNMCNIYTCPSPTKIKCKKEQKIKHKT